MEAAKCFFAQAKDVSHKPTRVTTDGHDSFPRAIRRILGRKVEHRTNRFARMKLPYYRLEQDHRGIKQRYYPMRGFGSFQPAAQFCLAFDEQRQYFRYRNKPEEKVPLAEQRRIFRHRFSAPGMPVAGSVEACNWHTWGSTATAWVLQGRLPASKSDTTHQGINQAIPKPIPNAPQAVELPKALASPTEVGERITSLPVLGGLHHDYRRVV